MSLLAVVEMASSKWHFRLFQRLDGKFKVFRSRNDSSVTGPSAASGVTPRRIMTNMLPCMIICVGVVLRFAQYIYNRSLWLDEAALTLNIIDRSFSELVRPLDYSQGAPVGFLMLERLAVQAFGRSEYVLRLIPFLSGVIALPLFYRVAKLCIKPEAVPIALSLFALSDPLIYYSSETKQYSSDVAIALLLCSALALDQSKRLAAPRIVFFGVLGAIAVWFSHPAAFILAGVGASLIASNLVKRKWAAIGGLSIAYSLWVLSFIACYYVCLRSLSENEILLNYWADAFMPLPPFDFSWFINTFFWIFKSPAGLPLTGIAALTFLVGCASMFREKKERFLVLISPVLITLLVSGLHKYPFGGRLLLFTVPSLLLFIAEGAQKIRDETKHHSAAIGIILIGLLLLHPSYFAAVHLIKPRTVEEIKPVLSYVAEHKRNGDLLYLSYASQYPFRYYSERYSFDADCCIVGVPHGEDYISDLSRLRGNKRIWILFSHIEPEKKKCFLNHLDAMGKRRDVFEGTGAAVYLYDLDKPTARIARR
jgi:hypothetical protein